MKTRYYRVTRLVVLPDYQGIGVEKRLLNFIAEIYVSQTKVPFYIPNEQSADNPGKYGKLEDNPIWPRKQGKRQHQNKQWIAQ